VRLAYLLLFTLPGAPCVYYGDEIGLDGGHDPACREAMPWDRPGAWDRGRLAWLRDLAALRHAHPALRTGDVEVAYAHRGVVALRRRLGDDDLLVVVNQRDDDAHARVPVAGLAAGVRMPLLGTAAVDVEDGVVHVRLPGRTGWWWRCRGRPRRGGRGGRPARGRARGRPAGPSGPDRRQRLRVLLAGADAHDVVERLHEDLAVADVAGAGGRHDRVDRRLHEGLRDGDLELDLLVELDDELAPRYCSVMPAWPPWPLTRLIVMPRTPALNRASLTAGRRSGRTMAVMSFIVSWAQSPAPTRTGSLSESALR
jgi:hypothetical protein